jgi:hypothetical protein
VQTQSSNDNRPVTPIEVVNSDVDSVTPAVMTAFLRTGKGIDYASSLILLTSVLVVGTRLSPLPSVAPLMEAIDSAGLLIALIEKYFAWRVGLDADLFAILRQFPRETEVFGAALAGCLGRKAMPPSRSMQSRWQGARRLLQFQGLALGIQVACVIAILAMRDMDLLASYMR